MRSLSVRIVALIAAYAVALHTLLLAFATIAPADAASHVTVLCSGLSSGDNSSPPAEPNTGCAMACAALGGTLAPEHSPAIVAVVPVVASRLLPVLATAPRSADVAGAAQARAPPLT